MGGVNKTRAVGPCAWEDLSPGPVSEDLWPHSVVTGTDVEWRGSLVPDELLRGLRS